MSYLCDLFFIFILIKRIISLKQAYLIFGNYLEYVLLPLDGNMDEEHD